MDGENKELKRCPFCGSVAEVFQETMSARYGIRCLEFKCGAVVYFSFVSRRLAETVEHWNSRAIGTCKDCKYSYRGNYFRGYACSYNDNGIDPNTVKEDHSCGYWKPKYKEEV